MAMILELLAQKNTLRVLHAVRRKPMRFGDLQKALRLNPAQVDRALKFLCKGLWIVPRIIPSEKGRLLVEYAIGKRGAAFLDSFRVFSDDASRRKSDLGADAVAELRSVAR